MAADEAWGRETVPRVMELVSPRLPQRDACALLAISPWCYRALVTNPKLWEVLDLREMKNAGDRLISALSLARYRHLKLLNLEFAQDVEDRHFVHLKEMARFALILYFKNFKGIDRIQSFVPKALIGKFPIGIESSKIPLLFLHSNGGLILNNISDKGMWLIANSYQGLKKLNITRCVKLTDNGLKEVLQKCSSLESLNLYALSSFTDKVYKEIGLLSNLTFLDLCGAQNLSDDGLVCISRCRGLTYLNLTWCVRVTDAGVVAIAQGCWSLELLSLFGIVGVTDACLEALSKSCSHSLTTLDVNGCIGIKRRSRDDLLKLFPFLTCFKVHS
ncbi:F-box protein [Dichanthelium oligosanthes]|uniref:F-box protein n=1 Tax=Dichanthelium oligosanthes TaxID=888268 RepID=A0A1E5USS1_9POAL|nr:F-box protein [Dichanthelium oligosanthes]